MLTKNQFALLSYIAARPAGEPALSQRAIAQGTGKALGTVNGMVKELSAMGCLDGANRITDAGLAALAPYRVDNAVIMAAGMSSRFAPLSYEKPKALLKVKGEVLIEREIRQLQAAGIDDITVVVGYMKEKLFYLEDRFHVKIVINEDYHRYNNPSTLMLVRDRLKNTFICSSDNYFEQNPFEPYVYQAYYASLYSAGKTDEYCMVTNRKGRITGVQVGGSDAWYMIGHAYFDRSFSEKFTQILEREYDSPVTRAGLWEDLYARHIRELEMYIRKYPGGIHEFDSLDELRAFDSAYVTNADSYIFDNICAVLHCTPDSIHGIIPIKTGLTNLSFKFTCNGRDYVYRHPGAGTEAYIDRPAEAQALEAAKALGLDDTFLYIDAAKGWKISHYIEDAAILDYHNDEQVDTALRMLRRLHTSGIQLDGRFDIWEKINGFLDLLQGTDVSDFTGMQELHETMCALHERLKGDAVPLCACHCDSYNPNFPDSLHFLLILI